MFYNSLFSSNLYYNVSFFSVFYNIFMRKAAEGPTVNYHHSRSTPALQTRHFFPIPQFHLLTPYLCTFPPISTLPCPRYPRHVKMESPPPTTQASHPMPDPHLHALESPLARRGIGKSWSRLRHVGLSFSL